MAVTGVPAKMRVLVHVMQTSSRKEWSSCYDLTRQKRWEEAQVASHEVTVQLFHQ